MTLCRTRGLLTTMVVLSSLGAQLAHAQWLGGSSAKIPRTADGKVNFTAPIPRAVDGKADLSGVWRRVGAAGGTDIGEIPFQPWAAATFKQRATDGGKDDPALQCLPSSLPRLALWSLHKIVQSPQAVIVLYEASN